MALNQLATLAAPEATLITITPWDAGTVNTIMKAIQTSDLGINPSSDGRVIRLPIPPLNEARRKELVKQVSGKAEEARVAVRNVRRHAVDELRKMLKAGDVPEDDERRAEDEVERLTHLHNERIETVTKAKEREVMDV
jgi:ribosome recycling factor